VLTLSTFVRAIVREAYLPSLLSGGPVAWGRGDGRKLPGRLKGMGELGKVSRRTAISKTESPSVRPRKTKLCSMRLSGACLR